MKGEKQHYKNLGKELLDIIETLHSHEAFEYTTGIKINNKILKITISPMILPYMGVALGETKEEAIERIEKYNRGEN